MELGLTVVLSATMWMGEDRVEVSLGAVKGGKYVVEFTSPDNVEHYWFDSFDEARTNFIVTIADNVNGMDRVSVS